MEFTADRGGGATCRWAMPPQAATRPGEAKVSATPMVELVSLDGAHQGGLNGTHLRALVPSMSG